MTFPGQVPVPEAQLGAKVESVEGRIECWKPTGNVRWLKVRINELAWHPQAMLDRQGHHVVLQQQFIEVNTGEVSWTDVVVES